MKENLVSLVTGKARLRTIKDLWSCQLSVSFEERKGYPEAERFVSDIMCDRPDLVTYIQQLCGYFLTGETADRKFYGPYGGGMNGKSALFALLRDILGPFYLTAHKDLYVQTHSHHSSAGAAEPHKVALKGKRLAVLEETKQEDKLDISQIKQFVQDMEMMISARDLFKPSNDMEFRVVAKHCILTNNILRFNREAGDKGGTDRFTTIPFDMRFTTDTREIEKELAQGKYCKLADRNTVEALRTIHLSQVFSFFVEGAMAWYRNNQCLPCPKEVVDATQGTMADGDRVQQFIDQCCEIGTGEGFFVMLVQLYNAYQDWWHENIQEPSGMETKTKFGDILCKSKGFQRGDDHREYIDGKQERVYRGLKIKLV